MPECLCGCGAYTSRKYARGHSTRVLGSPRRRGADHPRWNGGRSLSSHGYVKIQVGKEHPHADPNGYAYEHLLVWLEAGNPPPGKNEVLHHINENKTDNRLANLQCISRLAHAREHHDMVTDEVVLTIRQRYAAGERGTALAEEYGIPVARAYRYIKGETRIDVGGPIATGDRRARGRRHMRAEVP